ncbi:metacaspase-1-like [Neltuma alba]|uniref:metacaspase-1-like n=1 Tax=Neltuma alba TaxID=207710 RepID=UPI0010A39ADC|nr:metacaspase-1-like [Prosopis alba]
MAAISQRSCCACGAPPGVPHYCPANNNRVVVYGSNKHGARNRVYHQQLPCRPAVAAVRPRRQPQPPLMGGEYYYCGGNKRALLCGITYGNGPHPLKGSVNDVLFMKEFLIQNLGFHPHSIVLLRDDMYNNPKTVPTKANIIEAMRLLVRGCREGDSLLFHYSGHGSNVVDDDGDEVDGYDEAICPVDYEKAGKIVDDTINDILVKPLPRGTKLHAIIDSCKSGTVLDLPFMCRMNRLREYMWENQMRGRGHRKGTNGGTAICISACDDDGSTGDTSAFGMGGGALTHSFIKAMRNQLATTGGLSYGHLLHSMRSIILQTKQPFALNSYHQQFHINHRQHYSNVRP